MRDNRLLSLKLFPNGLSGAMFSPHFADPLSRGAPALRQNCKGWTPAVYARFMDFLFRISYFGLMDFAPVAFSGTVANWPPTPAAFHSAINRWLSGLRRADLVHYFWVMEFQRRGHPHFHACLFFPHVPVLARIRNLWLNAAADFGASFSAHLCPDEILFGRNARPCIRHIKGMEQWTGYMGKTFLHAMRSYDHSQRSYNVADAPLEWNENTGRVWGRNRDFPLGELTKYDSDFFSPEVFKLFARLVRRWRFSKIRDAVNDYPALLSSGGVYRIPRSPATRAIMNARRSARSMQHDTPPTIPRFSVAYTHSVRLLEYAIAACGGDDGDAGGGGSVAGIVGNVKGVPF